MLSRRKFLLGGGIALGTAPIAGCTDLDLGGPSGGSGDGDAGFPPATWIPGSPIDDGESSRVLTYVHVEPRKMTEIEGIDHDYYYDTSIDGVDDRDVDHIIYGTSWSVIRGDIAKSDVERTMDTELESVGEEHGYELYRVDEGFFAMKGGTLVFEPTERGLIDLLEVHGGERDRLADTNGDFPRLLELLGDGEAIVLSSPRPSSSGAVRTIWGSRFKFGNETSTVTHVEFFQDAESYDEDVVLQEAHDDLGFLEERPEIERDGRIATIEVEVETSKL